MHVNTPTGTPACLSIIGGGNSPTLEYDNYVVDKALAYLGEEHPRPQLLVVGTYAPHHPYVAPKELFVYYYDKVTVPEETFSLPSLERFFAIGIPKRCARLPNGCKMCYNGIKNEQVRWG